MRELSSLTISLIRAWAKSASPGGHDALADVLECRTRETDKGINVVDRAGNILINSDGSNADISDLVAALKKTSPQLFDYGPTPVDALATPPAPTARRNLTADAIAYNKKQREMVDRCPVANPWLASTRNITWQAILTNRDPTLADRLQREAAQS